MIILTLGGASLRYGDKTILEDISFSVNEGDRVGVIGSNGAGKTSLFRIITGEYSPTEGTVAFSRGKTVGYLSQNGTEGYVDESTTVLSYMYGAIPSVISLEKEIKETEEALLSATPEESLRLSAILLSQNERFAEIGGLTYRSKCESLLAKTGFVGSDLNLKISEISGGQRTRLSLARVLFSEPDILLLDEPTNHLDIETLMWLENYLSAYKKTLMVISHDRLFLDRTTNKTLVISSHHARLYPGNYSKTEQLRDAERAFEEKRYKLQQQEIARIEAHIAQQRQFGRERNFVTIRSREKALARMEKFEKPEAMQKGIKFSFSQASQGGNEVLHIKKLSHAFPPAPFLFRDIDLSLYKGERVFIVGANGCGKSTLLKIVCGKLTQTEGKAEFGYNIKPAYFDQENQGLSETNTVFDELKATYPQLKDGEIRSRAAQFRFCGEDVFKTVSLLSGGERARLTLSKLIGGGANLLILDEPTNHLDIDSKEVLEEAISEYDGTVLAVSHDRYFIDKLATKIVEINPPELGGVNVYPLGLDDGFDTYLEEREKRRAAVQTEETVLSQPQSSAKEDYLKRKEQASEERKRERRKMLREKRIAEIEEKIPEIEKRLFGEAATDYKLAAELQAELDSLEEELLNLYGEE